MITIKEKIQARILALPKVTKYTGDRIYTMLKPQNSTLPAIVFSQISENRFSAMGSDVGVIKNRFQFDIYAETHEEADNIAYYLKEGLIRWRSDTKPKIYDVFLLNSTDIYEDEVKEFHIAIDLEINYYNE